MNFQHYDLGYNENGKVVEVVLKGTEANVCLMDTSNFQNYRSGRRFSHYGGHFKQSPVRLAVPHSGHWHVTIDLGGYGGSVNSSVRVL